MKILHVPYCYYPDRHGGTERYVQELIRRLAPSGVQSVVAAPGAANASGEFDGVPVHHFAVNAARETPLEELYGDGDPVAAANFARVLDSVAPDLVHLHAHSPAVSLRVARAVKMRGLPLVFTYHAATATCIRGSLVRNGVDVCDGVLDVRRCTSCFLRGKGVPANRAELLARIPPAASAVLRARSGGVWTAVRMSALLTLHQECVRELLATMDRIVAVAAWVAEVLERNGVPRERIELIRQGLPHDPPPATSARESTPGDELRVACLGRFEPLKGADVLVRALRSAPDLQVRVDLFGFTQSDTDAQYERELRALAAGDERVRFHDGIVAERVIDLMRGYDLIAVPSRCLETGPLVVLEAFAARTPVLGARLGGIAELVRDGVDGVLVPPDQPAAWAEALRALGDDRARVEQLRRGIRAPRTMNEVASEMLAVYQSVTATALASSLVGQGR